MNTATVHLNHEASDAMPRHLLVDGIEWLLTPVLMALSPLILLVYGVAFDRLAPFLLLTLLLSPLFVGTSRNKTSMWIVFLGLALRWIWLALLIGVMKHQLEPLASLDSQAFWLWTTVTPLFQFTAHLVLRATVPFATLLHNPLRNAVLVGATMQGSALAHRLASTGVPSIRLVGVFDDRSSRRHELPEPLPLLGRLADLPRYVVENDIHLIYISLPMTSERRVLTLLDELKDTTASVYFVPDIFVTDLIQGKSASVCGLPVIAVRETPFTGRNAVIKRLSDILLSLAIVTLMSPILLLIAVAIATTSRGPVLFKQRRYGLDGKEILIYKFRSMSVCEDGKIVPQAIRNDLRVTPLGRFLRRTSLDELPQFFNVLGGSMSIVGPRPHAVAHNEMYRKVISGYMIRHKVRPGITGWAQVNGFRGETDSIDKMQARVDHDLEYLRRWSLGMDLRIIAKTIVIIFCDRYAY